MELLFDGRDGVQVFDMFHGGDLDIFVRMGTTSRWLVSMAFVKGASPSASLTAETGCRYSANSTA
jgi:hypothetical protein